MTNEPAPQDPDRAAASPGRRLGSLAGGPGRGRQADHHARGGRAGDRRHPGAEGAVAFDIETAAEPGGSALDPWSGYIRLAQFYGGGPVAYVFDIEALGGPEILRPLADRRLVTFSGVFEAKFLKVAGLAFPLLDDAALAAGLRTRPRRTAAATWPR